MTALTNTAIEQLLPGEYLKDDRVPGLQVRCHHSGRSFMLYYRFHGRPRRPKIGEYGTIGISQARDIARGMLGEVAAGKDPSQVRSAARAEATVADLWERVEREHYARGRAWDREARRLWTQNLEKTFGRLRIGEVTVGQVDRWHKAQKATPTDANRTLAVLSKMFKLAIRWELREVNPCTAVERFKETSRRRFASPAELFKIGPLLDAAAGTDPHGVAFLYLLLYSGARPSEIERATWGQLERINDSGVLRIAEGKTGHRNVFLPPPAMRVIAMLTPRDNKAPNLAHAIVGIKMPRKLWHRIRVAAGCPDLWARDCRRTFGTVGYATGVSLGVIGDLLGHADPRMTKIYAKLMEDPAIAASAQIAGKMAKLLNGEQDARDGADTYAADY